MSVFIPDEDDEQLAQAVNEQAAAETVATEAKTWYTKVEKIMNLELNFEQLKDAIGSTTCDGLQRIARVINISDDMSKLERKAGVELIANAIMTHSDSLDRLKYPVFFTSSEDGPDGDNPDGDNPDGVSDYGDFKDCDKNTLLFISYKKEKTPETLLVCALLNAFDRLQKADKDKSPVPGCGTPSKFGGYEDKKYQTCPSGYKSKEGCCIKLEELFDLETQDIIKSGFSGINLDGIEDKDNKIKLQTKAMKALYGNAKVKEKDFAFSNIAERNVIKTFLDDVQRRSYKNLAAKFQLALDEDENEDETTGETCQNKTRAETIIGTKTYNWISETLTLTGNALSSFLRWVWRILYSIGAVAYGLANKIVGGTVIVVKSIAQKLAVFMVTHPQQARYYLAIVQYFRNELCKGVSLWLEKSGAFPIAVAKLQEKANQDKEAAQKEFDKLGYIGKVASFSSSLITAGMDKAGFDENKRGLLKSSGFFDLGNLAARLDFSKIGSAVTNVAAVALTAVPIAGPILSIGFTATTSMLADTVGAAGKEAATALLWAQDIQEIFYLIIDILDISKCMAHMPIIQYASPDIWFYVQSIQLSRLAEKIGGKKAEELMLADKKYDEERQNNYKAAFRIKKDEEKEAATNPTNSTDLMTATSSGTSASLFGGGKRHKSKLSYLFDT